MNKAGSASFAASRKIASILPIGRDKAITTGTLCDLLNVDVRSLRALIADERKAGEIILSRSDGRGGYYRPESREEVEECVRTLDAKARSIMAAIQSARRYLRQSAGQMTIDV